MMLHNSRVGEKRFTTLDLIELPRIKWKNLDKIRVDNTFLVNKIYFKALLGLDIKEYVECFRDRTTENLVVKYI